MKGVTMMVIFGLLFIISIIGIAVYIQFKLSRSKNKYLGLILPVISFIFSLLTVLGGAGYTNEVSYLSIFFSFLITNIPTIILTGIYLGERNKIDVKKSIEKMKIEDL